MYSQNNEEEIIVNHFGPKRGHFLDIGAYDGKTFSNTYRLVELGWSGVCIEPSVTVFPALLKLHGNRAKVQIVNALVGVDARGATLFYDSNGDAVSTTNKKHKMKWAKNMGVPYTPYHIMPMTFDNISFTFGNKFDFINLDVEGENFELLQAMPLDQWQNNLICIEFDDKFNEVKSLLKSKGYEQVGRTGENLIMSRG